MSDVRIVGVLNVTPDSYYDGGKFHSVEHAVRRAGEMLAEGADIIEVGGESTGPGSREVSLEEERTRSMSAIRAILEAYPDAHLSIDTWKSAIAFEAIEAGAVMVNDVTAGRGDPEMFSVVASSHASLVLMYAKDASPRTTVREERYTDVIATVKEFLRGRKKKAMVRGISEGRIILDPGMGHFVSSIPEYSFAILAGLHQFHDLHCPLFVSPSRKSFLSGSEHLPPGERLPATIAASAVAVLNGASYIRTHDVLPVRRGCEVALSVRGA